MDQQEFLQKRNELLEKKQAFLNEVNQEYTLIIADFLQKNSPVKNNKVYELIKNGTKRRGFKRFVIYQQDVSVMDGTDIFIRVGGWWLNEENIPTKWDTMTVLGVCNAATFVLSENQTNKPHPDAKPKN